MKRVESFLHALATVMFYTACAMMCIALFVGFSKILEIFREETGYDIGGFPVFIAVILAITMPLCIVDMFRVLARSTWLFRLLLFVISSTWVYFAWPSCEGILWLPMMFVSIMGVKSEWEKVGPGRGSKLWFRIRHLFFKGFVWDNMAMAELKSFELRYGKYMRLEERNFIVEKIKKYNHEENDRLLRLYKSKTGLDEVPSVQNPDRLLWYASSSAEKRGWTSVEEIKKEFEIDKERAEHIMRQLCELRVCGPSKEVHLTELEKDEIDCLLNMDRMGDLLMLDNETKEKAERIVEWFDNNNDISKDGVDDFYLEIVRRYTESNGRAMGKDEMWRVRDEVKALIGCKELIKYSKNFDE